MRRLLLAGALLLAMLIPAASANAALTGEYARFETCPTANTAVDGCVYAESTSGTFTMGAKAVPIKNPVILKGGLDSDTGSIFGNLTFVAPTDGVTLSKSPQPVPGGLLGIPAPTWWPSLLRELYEETINNGATGVTATVELAGPPSAIKFSAENELTGTGTALSMPVKVKLGNSFLGSNCYIGSNSNPIRLNLTTGATSPPPPNTSISGSPGELGVVEEGKIIYTKNNKLVDNSFAAPGANGCGGILFSWAVDPFVNSIVGVPAAAGTNTAILEGTTYIADANAVRAQR
ncbi:MAG TPA: hypothetical protein VG448_01005 [Solirubrobacterales bacterium]|nr:hypothetical protein [Solirubrobacterales bacterium]